MQNKKENDVDHLLELLEQFSGSFRERAIILAQNAVIEFAVELGADEDWGPTNG